MTKQEIKKQAIDILQSSIGVAYYQIQELNVTEEEEKAINEQLRKLATRACKAIGIEYITY